MKWLVKTLDNLLSHATENEAKVEQEKIENLIARYKNLIPTIEITMVKTEVFSKCYVYRREVHEVIELLNKVRSHVLPRELDSLTLVDKIIVEQQNAVQQLDSQRSHVMSMLQRGKDLNKDIHAPKFLNSELKTLEHGWNETYNETVDNLKMLKNVQKVWVDYNTQKHAVLSALATAETELRSITPAQTDPKSVTMDVAVKQQLSCDLEKTANKIQVINELCKKLTATTSEKEKSKLEKEVADLERSYANTLNHVKDRVAYLEDYSDKWNEYKKRLAELNAWATKDAPKLIEEIMSKNTSPEMKYTKTIELQNLVSEKMRALDLLNANAATLSPKEDNVSEFKRLKNEVLKLKDNLSGLNNFVEKEVVSVKQNLVVWNKCNKDIKEIKQWIDESKNKLSLDFMQIKTLQEAIPLQQEISEFIVLCEKNHDLLQETINLINDINDDEKKVEELEKLIAKCNNYRENAEHLMHKLGKIIHNWTLFETDIDKMAAWIDNAEKTKMDVNPQLQSIDKLEALSNQLQSFSNELSEQNAKIILLFQIYEQLKMYINPNYLVESKEQLQNFKGRLGQISGATRKKIDDVNSKINVRQHFNAKVADLNNWITKIHNDGMKVENIRIDEIEPSYQTVVSLLQQQNEMKNKFHNVYEDVKNASETPTGNVSDLNDIYSTLANNFKNLETNLSDKKNILEQWINLLQWINDTRDFLNHLNHQMEKCDGFLDYQSISDNITDIYKNLGDWKNNVSAIDQNNTLHIKDENYKIVSATQLLSDLEGDLEVNKLKVENKLKDLSTLEERKNSFKSNEKVLINFLNVTGKKLKDILSKEAKLDGVENVLGELNTLSDEFNKEKHLLENIKYEGNILLKNDLANLTNIQEALLVLDKEWNNLDDGINNYIQKYNILTDDIKEYNNVKNILTTELGKIKANQPTKISPELNLDQLTDIDVKSRKNLDAIKKLKHQVDELHRRGESVLSAINSTGKVAGQDVVDEVTQLQNDWKNMFEVIVKNVNLIENKLVLWKQIDAAAGDINNWISLINESLTSSSDCVPEIAYKFHKYKSEIPFYLNLKNDIQLKCENYQNFNENVLPIELEKCVQEINTGLDETDKKCNDLESLADVYSAQEKMLRDKIKTVGESINKLRDFLTRCDDMSGDNAKIIERLCNCRSFKETISQIQDEIAGLKQNYSSVCEKYPNIQKSIIPKELENLEKRFEIADANFNKIESSLLQFVLKSHKDKNATLNRVISTQKEKINWCKPEASSDKYNLEIKLSSLADIETCINNCEKQSDDLIKSLENMKAIASPADFKEFQTNHKKTIKELNVLKDLYQNVKKDLDDNIDLWNQYDEHSKNISQQLRELEIKCKPETTFQFTLADLDDKINETQAMKNLIDEQNLDLQKIVNIADELNKKNPDLRVNNLVGHFTTRHTTIQNFLVKQLERLKNYKQIYNDFCGDCDKFKKWLKEIEEKQKAVTNSGDLKGILKEMSENEKILNKMVELGESLYPGITSECRENLRTTLKTLKNNYDQLYYGTNDQLKKAEADLVQKQSIVEIHNEVKKCFGDLQSSTPKDIELCATLPEKKSLLNAKKTKLDDLNIRYNTLEQLLKKANSLADDDNVKKIKNSLKDYNNLKDSLKNQIAVCENVVSNHIAYLGLIENIRDWLVSLNTDYVDITGEVFLDKDKLEEQESVLENIISQKVDAQQQFAKCSEQLQVVLKETHEKGHPPLMESFSNQKDTWEQLINVSEQNKLKLRNMNQQMNNCQNNIKQVEDFIKKIEPVIKDQTLKNGIDSKLQHLAKLNQINEEIANKQPEIANIIDESRNLGSDADLSLKISYVNSKYQAVQNACKEAINKYETYINDHKLFDNEFDNFEKWLKTSISELKKNDNLVGDLAVMQQRQVNIRELANSRINRSTAFETIIDNGEKLYTHTSPEGREVIRQKLKQIRTLWDSLTDDLNTITQKIEQCILQFSDFTISQELLSKWLKDIESSMQTHVELKATLQEKRAQCQNHKLIHQEIISQNSLVEAVCEKARNLVNQTHDESLNDYITSIVDLYKNIETKSQDLLNNLEVCAQSHNDLNMKLTALKKWLTEEQEKVLNCLENNGEKYEITKKLELLEKMKTNKLNGETLLKNVKDSYAVVKKGTSPKGNEILSKEIKENEDKMKQLLEQIDGLIETQSNALKEWIDFEKTLDELTKWCRNIEAIFKHQQLHSTLKEKEDQLNIYKKHLDEISAQEKKIDGFIDRANNLLNSSGVEKIKILISQLNNRYQLLQVLSKEVYNRSKNIHNDHKEYENKLNETLALLKAIDTTVNNFSNEVQNKNILDSNLGQQFDADKDKFENTLMHLVNFSEKILPETATPGREKIRDDINNIKDNWDKIILAMKNLRKNLSIKNLHWSNYVEALQQSLAWLESIENKLQQETGKPWQSTQDLRSKLFKLKTILQEIMSHKRFVDALNEKANTIGGDEANKDIENKVSNIETRYDKVKLLCSEIITKHEQALEVCLKFNGLQKMCQDNQKQLWDELTNYTDHIDNKIAMQSKSSKMTEIEEKIPGVQLKLDEISKLIVDYGMIIPENIKEIMVKDSNTMKREFENFLARLNETKTDAEKRKQLWVEWTREIDQLNNWLDNSEMELKNNALKPTLEDKQEQLNKVLATIMVLNQKELEFDKLLDKCSELIQNSGDSKLNVQMHQIKSRLQSVENTMKEMSKKCEYAVEDHTQFNNRYAKCVSELAKVNNTFEDCKNFAKISDPKELEDKQRAIRKLLDQQNEMNVLVGNTIDLGQKIYSTTSTDGHESIRNQLEELQQNYDETFDKIKNSAKLIELKLSKLQGFNVQLQNILEWLETLKTRLPDQMELKSTLDEKNECLHSYKTILQEITNYQKDIATINEIVENVSDDTDADNQQLNLINTTFNEQLKRAQNYVERYETIVLNHQQYCKGVMEMQDFIEATYNTIDIWGVLDLEQVSLRINLDRFKNLQNSLSDEALRVEQIRCLGVKVIPDTAELGQNNIQSQLDNSQQEWEGLIATIESTVTSIENKLAQWDEFEILRDECHAWIREIDNKLHSIDLKSTLLEKKDQMEYLKEIQGEIKAKELEIDNVTEKSQKLCKGITTSRSSQVSDIVLKYQQLSHRIKELNTRWQDYVVNHQELDAQISEFSHWLNDIKTKLEYCADLSATSEKDLENKLQVIQDLVLQKDKGSVSIQNIVDLAQNVLANTATKGHDDINKSVSKLQEEWSIIALKMFDIKSNLDNSINLWSGFLDQIQNVRSVVDWIENTYKELAEYQTSMAEKRAQLEKIRNVEEKIRLEKLEVDALKAKTSDMLNKGKQLQAASQAQEVLHKFDKLNNDINKLLSEREKQYRDHRLYKEAFDDLTNWLNRAREKLPDMKQRSLSDKISIDNITSTLDGLLNKQAQGELLVEHLQHTGEVLLPSTSRSGQDMIKTDIRSIKSGFENFFADVLKQRKDLEKTIILWREFKEEFEKLSEWLQQIDILVKNHKLATMPNLEEKKNQIKDMKEILTRLENGQVTFDNFNKSAEPLLSSHLDTYISNQLRHINSRYQIQMNLAKDVLKKIENCYDQHKEFNENYQKANAWMDNAKEVIRQSTEIPSSSTKENLQQRLDQLLNVIHKREDGHNLVNLTVSTGEKVVKNTRSDGKDVINNQIKDIQTDWDRLVKKMTSSKVNLETSILQWADYNSSFNHLQKWMNDREDKLKQVSEPSASRVARSGQPRLSSGLSERKANLRQTNDIVQDIVSLEPMIQSVTSKASDLHQTSPASEISAKYNSLSKQAKELYTKQKETVEQHQLFIDAGNEFAHWIRNAKENLSKCSEPIGDKETLLSKIVQIQNLENDVPIGQQKLQTALEQANIACSSVAPSDREMIEEEVAMMQTEFDNYV